MSINLSYGTREAFISLRRNWVMSIAAVTTVAISLAILGAFVVLALNMSALIKKYESDVAITVFMRNSALPGDIASFSRKVRSLTNVSAVDYISKEQALDRLKKQLDDPDIVKQLDVNPLPPSLEVRMKDSKTVKRVAATIEKADDNRLIDEVKFGGVVTERLFAVLSVVRSIGIAFFILLGFASLIIISNTIRLAIFSRRKEIGIQKLVGATNWFIRWPFLLEGVIQGVVGALLAMLLLSAADNFFVQNLLITLPFLSLDTQSVNTSGLTGSIVLAGAVIGALGSVVAIRRYLRT